MAMQQSTDRLRHPRLNLIEERLGRNLWRYVAEHRPDVSWRLIARDLGEATGVTVSGEAIRLWWSATQSQTPALAGSRSS